MPQRNYTTNKQTARETPRHAPAGRTDCVESPTRTPHTAYSCASTVPRVCRMRRRSHIWRSGNSRAAISDPSLRWAGARRVGGSRRRTERGRKRREAKTIQQERVETSSDERGREKMMRVETMFLLHNVASKTLEEKL